MVSIPIVNEPGPSPHQNYRATPGSRLKDDDARLIGEVVDEIVEEKGRVVPSDLVEAATPDDAPLHRFFQWDNQIAARQYRLDQARRLLRAVEVEIVVRAADGSVGKEWTRTYRNVKVAGDGEAQDGRNPPRQSVYIPIVIARTEPDMMAQIIQEAGRYLRAWRAKYRQYLAIAEFTATFGELFAAMDAADNPDRAHEVEETPDTPEEVANQGNESSSHSVEDDESESPNLPPVS
jgi:hypothetical protein